MIMEYKNKTCMEKIITSEEKKWNEKVLAITLKIQKEHPELSKYLAEMPVTIPDEKHPDINVTALKDYYESLENLLTKTP